MRNLFKVFGIIALVAVIGFSMAACDDGGGDDPQKVTYVSEDSNGNKYTLEIDESGGRSARSAAQEGDKFKLTVEYESGNVKVTFVYEGKIGSAQTTGEQVKLTLVINGETVTITIVGTNMTVISGRIVDEDGDEVVDNPGTVTPVNPSPSPNTSLDGVWVNNANSITITINGSSGTLTSYNPTDALGIDAKNKGYFTVGTQVFRNLSSTGNLTWSGQELGVTHSTSNPDVATGSDWLNCTITMSANGQTITKSVTSTTGAVTTSTYTRGSHSLNGVWIRDNNEVVITISGSSGTLTSYNPTDALGIDAKNKDYLTVGKQTLRNLTSTGTLTWSGQELGVTHTTSSPDVATGSDWLNCTITMSANGQTITKSVTSTTGAVTTSIYTRQ